MLILKEKLTSRTYILFRNMNRHDEISQFYCKLTMDEFSSNHKLVKLTNRIDFDFQFGLKNS